MTYVPEPTILGQPNPDRCVACEEIELANVHDARPSQLLPIPNMALAGFPEGRTPRALTRRRLMQLGAAGVASVYAPRALRWESVWESAVAEAAGSPPPRALVMLYLAGGQDGLNVVLPGSASGSQYTTYVAKRPAIHRIQGATTTGSGGRVGSHDIPNTSGALAFANPVLSTPAGGDNGDSTHGFDMLFGNGNGDAGSQLALLPGVDYTPPNLSHFTSSDYWFAGDLEQLATGWLGRWLDTYGSATNPLQGISIGQSLSKALRPASAPVCTLSSLSSTGFSLKPGYGSPGGDATAADANALLNPLTQIPAAPTNLPLAHTRDAYALELSVHTQTASLSPTYGSGYPTTGSLSPQLKLAAFLLSAALGTRIITIHWGGFDTHGSQISQQDPQLIELSRALSAFQADLATRGLADQTAVLMFSEFGRRVAENGSAGTDHGAGGLMMLSGTQVKGGVATPPPDLNHLDGNGDLAVEYDFRSVYQETIANWLGGDPSVILPNGPFSALSLFR